MIRYHPLPMVQQAQLLDIARSTIYYTHRTSQQLTGH